MKLVRVSKPGQPDLLIHQDAVAQHEHLGWTDLGEEEIAPPDPAKAKGRRKATGEDAGGQDASDAGSDAEADGDESSGDEGQA